MKSLYYRFKKISQKLSSQLFAERFSLEFVDDFPNKLESNKLYIEGEQGEESIGKFLCPCECGEVITISFLKDTKHTWRVTYSGFRKKNFTIRPSVWRTKNCKSHFFITKGKIDWCRGN